MRAGIEVVADPEPGRLAELAASAPHNPFLTPEYALAMQALGERVLVFDNTGGTGPATLGLLRRGWRGCTVRIDSVPAWPATASIWSALLAWCETQAVTRLDIGSYASRVTDIPDLGPACVARPREEFTLPLDAAEPARLSSQHRRNAGRARRAGLIAGYGTDLDHASVHAGLVALSMHRLAGRGEPVSTNVDAARPHALVRHGAAEIHVARRDDAVLASVLVLRSARAGYYHSAGTTDEDRACGAATFLVLEIARSLASRGADVLHLGGAAPTEDGLRRFKTGFGAETRSLAAATVSLSPPLGRRAAGLWRKLRHR